MGRKLSISSVSGKSGGTVGVSKPVVEVEVAEAENARRHWSTAKETACHWVASCSIGLIITVSPFVTSGMVAPTLSHPLRALVGQAYK